MVIKYLTFICKRGIWSIYTTVCEENEMPPWQHPSALGHSETKSWFPYPVSVFGISEGPAGVVFDNAGQPMVIYVEQSFLGVNINLLPDRVLKADS